MAVGFKLTVRSFSSAAAALAPAVKPKINPRIPLHKRKAAEEDGANAAGSGSGVGNVLEEMKAPKLDLSNLKAFHPEEVTSQAVGQVRAFTPTTLNAFKSFTLPSLIQKEFAFTPRPSTVIRSATLTATSILNQDAGESKNSRHIFIGPPGSGKSVLLLQTVSYAHSTGWIVFYLPSTTPLVDSSTPHSYSAASKLFHQPLLSSQLLSKFLGANSDSLKKAVLSKDRTVSGKTFAAQKATLAEFISAICKDEKGAAGGMLEAVLEELSTQTQFPVLLALDDSQSLFTTSSYVDPTYKPVESHSLEVPRLLLEFISGQKSFAKGVILLAPSNLSARQSPALTEYLSTSSKESNEPETIDVYKSILKGVEPVQIPPRLERGEAVGLLNLIQSWRGVRGEVSDRTFLEHYIGADGNAREFNKSLEKSKQL